ncbi:orotidine-5'-phosphate decarboxylase [Microbacterium mitrae]|uniref:Orotidine-5'-phosphate decarboxylase n=1 Tax=Microbacterium mitrae TaxID=664640 RepID=A0A5C8HNI7_9MICO|nr:orotidine-5'-phosphate decarboxylase [Microbacterium mitrae]TXK05535.1 orotidine-5'-phosphate decarboxylase [Microbacterium mitrae]
MTIAFGTKTREAILTHGALCVGIDPHESLLNDWNLPVSAAGAREFGLRVVDASAGEVGFVKPQASFYERFGSAGFAALEDVTRAARAAGILVIADAKRGDIGTTMAGYAQAWLAPGSPLEADALTVSPYLGPTSLRETMTFAHQHGKGLFVLSATSNPEAGELQRAVVSAGTGQESVAAAVISSVSAFNADTADGHGWGSMGFVIGATVDQASLGLPAQLTPRAPILAPGFGAQGPALAELGELFGANAPSVIASESRGILRAGPVGLEDAIRSRKNELEVTRG